MTNERDHTPTPPIRVYPGDHEALYQALQRTSLARLDLSVITDEIMQALQQVGYTVARLPLELSIELVLAEHARRDRDGDANRPLAEELAEFMRARHNPDDPGAFD